jgi:prolyl oligopeptidase
MSRTALFSLILAALLAAPAPARAGFLGGDATPGPSQRLKTSFEEYWTDLMRADPLEATFNGDHRFDDRLGDPSEAALELRNQRDRRRLAGLRAIDGAKLSDDERIDRQVLVFTLEDRLAGLPFRGHLVPLTQQEGLHLKFAQSVNFHPVATAGDLENYVRRLRAFPKAVDATIALMRQGMKEKRVPPRLTMELVLPQLRSLAAKKAEDSPLWGIIDRLPREWSDHDRGRVAADVRRAIDEAVSPAYATLARFVESEYVPDCRETVGIWDTPDGPAYYAYLVRSFTTLPLTPDEVHETGLREMARNREASDAIRKRVGFPGDLKAFYNELKTNPKFKNTSPQGILDGYTAIFRAIDAQLPRLFGRLPRTDYALKPIEAYRAKSAAGGYYYPAPEDGSRPGLFYVNTFEPESRSTYTMQALAYHEAVPGHHLQFALAMEVPGRPAFRKFGYFPAYSEGWALYSESLPREVGLYADPYAELGQLEYNAWRCGRLVVDTGLHHKRWSRAQAIAYLEENTAVPRLEIESEVDRYIAWPGQALAYKVGELKIRELRRRAEVRLGAAFDVRAFHDRVLAVGSVPLAVLEAYMDPPQP